MATSKKTVVSPEIKTIDQLRSELVGKQNDLITAKKGHRLGELTNPHVLTLTRKEIARLYTLIRAAEIANIRSLAKGEK